MLTRMVRSPPKNSVSLLTDVAAKHVVVKAAGGKVTVLAGVETAMVRDQVEIEGVDRMAIDRNVRIQSSFHAAAIPSLLGSTQW